jgi:hypothetical protein
MAERLENVDMKLELMVVITTGSPKGRGFLAFGIAITWVLPTMMK